MTTGEGAVVRVRRAVPADIDRLIQIRGAVHENRLGDPSSVTRGDYDDFVGRGLVWAAEAGAVIAGFAAGDDRDGTVWGLFLDPAQQGQGFGRALLDRVTADLFAAGYRRIRLSTDPGTRAEAFYLRRGWTRMGLDDTGEVVFTLDA